jgi:hypothetical protein
MRGTLSLGICAEPREFLRRNDGETLVERLEYLAPLVEEVAPCWVVIGNAGVEDEIVIPAGHGERVELDRAEPAEDLEHCIGPASERSRGREKVVRDEEAPRGSAVTFTDKTLPDGSSPVPGSPRVLRKAARATAEIPGATFVSFPARQRSANASEGRSRRR